MFYIQQHLTELRWILPRENRAGDVLRGCRGRVKLNYEKQLVRECSAGCNLLRFRSFY